MGVRHKYGPSLSQFEQWKQRRSRKPTLSPVHRACVRLGRPLEGRFEGLVIRMKAVSTAFSRKALAKNEPSENFGQGTAPIRAADSPMFMSRPGVIAVDAFHET